MSETTTTQTQTPTYAVALVNISDGSVQGHKAGCADLKRGNLRKHADHPFEVEVSSKEEARATYNADFDEETDGWYEIQWAACTKHVPATTEAPTEEPATEAPAKPAAKKTTAKAPTAAQMRAALVKTGELTRDQVNAHKGEDLKAAYLNLVPQATTTKAPAKPAAKKTSTKKTAAKKTPAKATGPKDDAITRHIAQVFAKVPAGTFLKAREITNTITKEFPKADQRPSDVTVYSRCHGGKLPAGLTGQNKPCGATKN